MLVRAAAAKLLRSGLPDGMNSWALSLILALAPCTLARGSRWAVRAACHPQASLWQQRLAFPFYAVLWVAYWLPAWRVSSALLCALWRCSSLAHLPAALFLDGAVLRQLIILALCAERWHLRADLELLARNGHHQVLCQALRVAAALRGADFGCWPLLAARNLLEARVHQVGAGGCC